MRLRMLIAAALAACTAQAQDRSILPEREVRICISPTRDTRIREAARIATRLFNDIDVRLEWLPPSECAMVPDAIRVSFVREPQQQSVSGALAYAFPYEGTRIVILKDRVEAMGGLTRFHLWLGYVLVHEITHILQGISYHSQEGIMKARWTQQDHFQITELRLGFTPDDVARIYAGLDRRFDRARKATRASL